MGEGQATGSELGYPMKGASGPLAQGNPLLGPGVDEVTYVEVASPPKGPHGGMGVTVT